MSFDCSVMKPKSNLVYRVLSRVFLVAGANGVSFSIIKLKSHAIPLVPLTREKKKKKKKREGFGGNGFDHR